MMNIMRLRTALLAFAVLLGVQVRAADLQIGNVTISLGQSQSSALTSLQHYELVTNSANDLALVYVKNASAPTRIGAVSFLQGRVAVVQRIWASFEAPAHPAEVTKALFSALQNAISTTGSTPIVTATEERPFDVKFQSLQFSFPNRRILLNSTLSEPPFLAEVTVTEEVFLPGQ
jgi:hypothetical protein